MQKKINPNRAEQGGGEGGGACTYEIKACVCVSVIVWGKEEYIGP